MTRLLGGRRLTLLKAAIAVAAFCATGAPLFAWYYFTASNGSRLQWVWSTSCNPNSRPITILVDKDTPGDRVNHLNVNAGHIVGQFNNASTNLLNTSVFYTSANVDSAAVESFMNNPTANRIVIVWDADGAVFDAAGLDKTSILGIGLPLTPNGARPQDICSGIILVNGQLTATDYKKTVLHELGHVFGFAHSIAGGNGGTLTVGAAALPIMYPFSKTGSSDSLNPDDKAGIHAVYGP